MKKEQKQALVLGAQVAMGEKYASPFWDDVSAALDTIESGKSKRTLQVKPRNLTPTVNVRHY